MKEKRLLGIIAIFMISVLLATACTGPTQGEASGPEAVANGVDGSDHDEGEEHMEGDEHKEDEEHIEDEHLEGDEHLEDEHDAAPEHGPDEHMAGAHEVPEEAAEVPNPIAYSDASVTAGGLVYAASCAVCHGENGEGDGPTAAALEKPPADLHESHVQELSDGALFHIITHGRADTPMPAWEEVLEEDQRWNVVNFLRTFQE